MLYQMQAAPFIEAAIRKLVRQDVIDKTQPKRNTNGQQQLPIGCNAASKGLVLPECIGNAC